MQWLRIISSECWLRSVVTTVVHINCYIRLMLVVALLKVTWDMSRVLHTLSFAVLIPMKRGMLHLYQLSLILIISDDVHDFLLLDAVGFGLLNRT